MTPPTFADVADVSSVQSCLETTPSVTVPHGPAASNVKLVPTPQVSLHTKEFPTLENTPLPSQLSWISLAALVAVYPDWHVGVHVSPVVFWLHEA
jgi:hypothetical protein